MTPEQAVELVRQALLITVLLGTPILLIGFIIGIIVNLIQVATSIQDSAFSAVPRLAAFLAGIFFLAPWMLRQLSTYSVQLFSNLSPYAR